MNIGILGNGQLAQMLSLSAFPLGIRTLAISEKKEDSNNGITPQFSGGYLNQNDLAQFCQHIDVVTFETENIPLSVALFCQTHQKLAPSAKILELAQDRLFEKNLFRELNIPVAEFFEINTLNELKDALKQIPPPAILKTRRMGYDGKGQFRINHINQAEEAFQQLGGQNLILEAFVTFEREVSIIAVRNQNEIRFYPLIENIHQAGILSHSIIYQESTRCSLMISAQNYIRLIMEKFNYHGVLTIEFFVKDEKLIANEMAPRVHNSGHWTIEGCYTSQFENHARAILNLPLGQTQIKANTAMFNLIGTIPPIKELLAIENLAFHDYGKTPRMNRKLGHITLTESDTELFQQKVEYLKQWINFNRHYT